MPPAGGVVAMFPDGADWLCPPEFPAGWFWAAAPVVPSGAGGVEATSVARPKKPTRVLTINASFTGESFRF